MKVFDHIFIPYQIQDKFSVSKLSSDDSDGY